MIASTAPYTNTTNANDTTPNGTEALIPSQDALIPSQDVLIPSQDALTPINVAQNETTSDTCLNVQFGLHFNLTYTTNRKCGE